MLIEELYDDLAAHPFDNEVFIEIDDRVYPIQDIYTTSQGTFIVADLSDKDMR